MNTKQNMQLDLENTHCKALKTYKNLYNIESSFTYLDLPSGLRQKLTLSIFSCL